MHITFTGVDEQTDLQHLRTLLRPGMEIGILATNDPVGRHRYPRLEWITEAIHALAPYAAIHFCGASIRRALMRTETHDSWFDRRYGAHRMQINGQVEDSELKLLCRKFDYRRVITQHNPRNEPLARCLVYNHDLVVDASGGEGKLPARWEAPHTPYLAKSVGYAGGLNLETLPDAYQQIRKIAGYDPWIDMETGVRDSQDWFSIDKMQAIMDLFTRLEKVAA